MDKEQRFFFFVHYTELLALLIQAGSEQYGIWGSQRPLLHDICVPLRSIFKHFFRTCGFTVCLRGGLGAPEIDLFLRPNCLLNIIDHQSCHREKEKNRAATFTAKRGAFFEKLFIWRMSYLEPILGGRKWVIFQPLILPYLVAAGLIRTIVIIHVITCLQWNSMLILGLEG